MRRRVAWALVMSALFVVPSAAGWSWPVSGTVVQTFAFDPAHPYAGGQHRGIDIAASPGSTVVAPANGTVTFAGSVPGGPAVTILSGTYSVTLTQLGSASSQGRRCQRGATCGERGK
jgi:murein DD-endopeptidase MepM/ murein hydrolase activator NlpD